MKYGIYVYLIFFKFMFKVASYSLHFDSYLNSYKSLEYSPNYYKDIANTTWQEIVVSDKLINLVKCQPLLIDSDSELDLLVLDSETRLYWVSNVRGTSGDFNHQFISKSKILNFLVHGDSSDKYNFYILGINSQGNKILKFIPQENKMNKTIVWEESILFDLSSSEVNFIIQDNLITGFNLYPFSNEKQILYLSTKNIYTSNSLIIKITLLNQKVGQWIFTELNKPITLIGAYDMNQDSFVDLLYFDNSNNIFCLLNNDPYYNSVYISSISTIYGRDRNPRIYITDNNHDGYPDIITGNSKDNSIGLLFNLGKKFWDKVNIFMKKNDVTKIYKEETWQYIPLYDIYSYNLYKEKLIDFSVVPYKHLANKRTNFEIFAVYKTGVYWFTEQPLNLTSHLIWESAAQPRNYIYCMIKSDIVIDKITEENSNINNYKLIIDLDINFDSQPEFILYFAEKLYLIKKYTPYISGFGWNSSFWIYVCIYIYIVCSIIGLWEFLKLNRLNNKIYQEKKMRNDLKDKQNINTANELKNRINTISIHDINTFRNFANNEDSAESEVGNN